MPTEQTIRMHLTQALTRANTTDARQHVQAALNALDSQHARTNGGVQCNQIKQAECELFLTYIQTE